jgi:hypothetical protein
MQDRIVTIITILSAMLREVQENYELAQRRVEDLQYALDEERNRARNTDYYADYFRSFLRSPETFYATYMKGIGFLRSPEGLALVHSNQKIAAIRRVREITGYGLKEARDLVEAFFAYPSTEPAAE